jgi:phosphatidylinositol dimannoside acyltransferase
VTPVRDRLTDAGYALGWTLVCRVPESWARGAFQLGADIAWRRQGPGVRVLEANLLRVTGPSVTGKELRALSRQTMRSYARYWLEAFRLPVISQQRIQADMHVTGEENIQDNLAAGRGVIVALPHTGNYELAGAWIIGRGVGTFTTVAERLRPESLYRRFIDYREGLGFEVIPLSGGEQPPFPLLSQRLLDNKLVCLMAERDLSRHGVQVDFFGEPTRMPAGSARLAITTGAALLPVHSWYDGDDCRVDFDPPLDCSSGDVGVVTQALADVFARNIAEHPADWHMLQPQWLADLSQERQDRLGIRRAGAQRPGDQGQL